MHHIDKKLIRFRAEFALKTRKKGSNLSGSTFLPVSVLRHFFRYLYRLGINTECPKKSEFRYRDPGKYRSGSRYRRAHVAIGDIDFDACNWRSMRWEKIDHLFIRRKRNYQTKKKNIQTNKEKQKTKRWLDIYCYRTVFLHPFTWSTLIKRKVNPQRNHKCTASKKVGSVLFWGSNIVHFLYIL
jgi:hypothetical protein